MSDTEYDPLLKRKRRPPTEAELVARRNLSRDPGGFWELPDPHPYMRLTERKAIEIGLKGTF